MVLGRLHSRGKIYNKSNAQEKKLMIQETLSDANAHSESNTYTSIERELEDCKEDFSRIYDDWNRWAGMIEDKFHDLEESDGKVLPENEAEYDELDDMTMKAIDIRDEAEEYYFKVTEYLEQVQEMNEVGTKLVDTKKRIQLFQEDFGIDKVRKILQ